jgi:hypothetical protein
VTQVAAAAPIDEIPGRLDSLALDFSAAATELRQLLIRRWAEAQPASAAAWAAARADSADALPVIKQAAVVWADTDLSAAVEWLGTFPESALRQSASIAIAYEAARSDPVQALNLAIPLPHSEERDALLTYGMRQYAAKEPEAASAWAAQVVDSTLRNHLLEAVSTATSETDPSSAANLVSTSISPGVEQDRGAVSVVQRWAQVSPESAAAWVNVFPGGGVRMDAIHNLMSIWSRQNGQAATNWFNSLPEGKSLASAAP